MDLLKLRKKDSYGKKKIVISVVLLAIITGTTLTLIFTDIFGLNNDDGVKDDDADSEMPTITSPPADIEYELGTTDNVITWIWQDIIILIYIFIGGFHFHFFRIEVVNREYNPKYEDAQ